MVSTYNEILKIERRNFFMNKTFEKNFNDFLYEIKSNYLSNLLRENKNYIKLTNDMNIF